MLDSGDDLRRRLATAGGHLQNNDLPAAEAELIATLALQPEHPVALYMMGLLHARREKWSDAEACFRRALALSPRQPSVCLNLGLALRAQHRPGEAIAYCHIATEQAPDYRDAWAELAKAHEESGQAAEAEAAYRHILARGADAWAAANLAALLNRSGRGAEAERLLRAALSLLDGSEDAAPLNLQLAVALRSQRRHAEALDRLSPSQNLERDAAIERANLLQHLSRFDQAAAVYRDLLLRDPLDMETHTTLNELLYRHGGDDMLLASYDTALHERPHAARLPVAKGGFLLKLDRPAEARAMFDRALAITPNDVSALMGLGRALEQLGDLDAAARALENGALRHPENGDALEAFAAFLLRRAEIIRAQGLAEQACRLRPASQGALALLGLCYRVQGDARHDALNAFGSFVKVFDLEPPDGYSDMESFNRDLATYLAALHTDDREYPFQTVRGGTQLHDTVFYNGHALIDRLLPRIHHAMRTYIAQLPASDRHPFVSRRGKGFTYAGSWSTRLTDRGFHVNHIHQKGWISSCYYVAVPDAAANAETREGWIKFGEPSADFGAGFPPALTVQPRPGRLVLFPSYMWHGTVPFHSPQARTTIAFDAVPVP